MRNSKETEKKTPVPLAFKPDLEEAAKRWDAYLEGEIIDRPIVCVTAPKEGCPPVQPVNVCDYHAKVFGDIAAIVEQELRYGEATFFGGESIPHYFPSMGPDEIAVFCGGELHWSDNTDVNQMTNWSKPVVRDWEEFLPIRLDENNALWQRLLLFYREGSAGLAGRMLLTPPDLHTNMDLLAALRGPGNLCMDLMDDPEMIDRVMESARAVFPVIWGETSKAGQLDKYGYSNGFYSMEGAGVLQCDFSCMISPEMFRRWVLPALEEEAELVRHAYYHWDGPGALVHADDLIASKGLHTLSYVPGTGRGQPVDYIELYQKVQKGGKSVHVWGSPDELKQMHRALKPEKVMYTTQTKSQSEAQSLLEWFVKNT